MEMQSPEGSRLRGFYFRLHPLMARERGWRISVLLYAITTSMGGLYYSAGRRRWGVRARKSSPKRYRLGQRLLDF
jgi:hypothetical protein